jgi:filamentous hemagglutinin
MSKGRSADPSHVEWFVAGIVAARKLDAYLLSPTHPTGRHKARLWGSVFGFTQGDDALLEKLIREQLDQATPVEMKSTTVRKWELVIPRFRGPNGNEGPVLTAWALAPGKDRPHLTTAYPIVGD